MRCHANAVLRSGMPCHAGTHVMHGTVLQTLLPPSPQLYHPKTTCQAQEVSRRALGLLSRQPWLAAYTRSPVPERIRCCTMILLRKVCCLPASLT